MKNNLTHIFNYEKITFDKKNKKSDMTSVNIEKTLEYLNTLSRVPYGLKISQRIIYVTEYFYMFFSTLKDIIQVQSKTDH